MAKVGANVVVRGWCVGLSSALLLACGGSSGEHDLNGGSHRRGSSGYGATASTGGGTAYAGGGTASGGAPVIPGPGPGPGCEYSVEEQLAYCEYGVFPLECVFFEDGSAECWWEGTPPATGGMHQGAGGWVGEGAGGWAGEGVGGGIGGFAGGGGGGASGGASGGATGWPAGGSGGVGSQPWSDQCWAEFYDCSATATWFCDTVDPESCTAAHQACTSQLDGCLAEQPECQATVERCFDDVDVCHEQYGDHPDCEELFQVCLNLFTECD